MVWGGQGTPLRKWPNSKRHRAMQIMQKSQGRKSPVRPRIERRTDSKHSNTETDMGRRKVSKTKKIKNILMFLALTRCKSLEENCFVSWFGRFFGGREREIHSVHVDSPLRHPSEDIETFRHGSGAHWKV